MKIPTNLKIILIIWSILGLIYITVIGGILLIGFFQLIIGKSPNPFPFNIIVYLIVFIALLLGIYLLKVCYYLWHGQSNAQFPLRIFAGISLLNIPFGTVLGIATFIILSRIDVETFLNKGKPPTTKENILNEISKLKKE